MSNKDNNEVKRIIEENKYNEKLRKYSDKYCSRDSNVYGEVNNNVDVNRYLTSAKNTMNYYENKFPYKLINDDIDIMKKELGNFEIALRKVLHCYYNKNCNFTYTANELQELINYLDEFNNSIDNVWMRKVCQD